MGSNSNEEEERKISQSQRNFRSHSENFAVVAKMDFFYHSENGFSLS